MTTAEKARQMLIDAGVQPEQFTSGSFWQGVLDHLAATIEAAVTVACASEAYRLGLQHGKVLSEMHDAKEKLESALRMIEQLARQGVRAGVEQGAMLWSTHLEQIATAAKEVLR